MTRTNKKGEFGRLEDFIELAKQGRTIGVEIKLKRQSVIQKINFAKTEESGGDIETYLLVADYLFKIEGQKHKISKVYMFATATESANANRANANIANFRLQVDYGRISAVGIKFAPKFF
jgi:hypothetical protein